MAYDKLVDSSQLNSDLGDVADAIRAKSGGSSQLAFPSGFISEIGNISTGGGSIAPINILDGVQIYAGYIDANGRPAAQSATNKEYYTDAIDVTPYIGKDIVVGVMTKNGGRHWVGRAFYDENGTFVNRDNIMYGDSTKICGMAFRFSVPTSGVKTMRLAWRALTGCVYFAAVYDDTIFSALESVGFNSIIST